MQATAKAKVHLIAAGDVTNLCMNASARAGDGLAVAVERHEVSRHWLVEIHMARLCNLKHSKLGRCAGSPDKSAHLAVG